jgi:hypothetical protein
VTATKSAVAMATRVADKDEGNGEGGKSDGNGVKGAIPRRKAMASNNNNEMMATETMTQHCCCCHHYPCLSHPGSSFCVGVLAAAGNDWWWRMRTKVGAQEGWGEF